MAGDRAQPRAGGVPEEGQPRFRERHVESERPGQLLSADTFMVGTIKGIGRVYLHAVVDTFGSYAFGFLHVSKQPEAAVAVLHNDVLPFYARLDLPVQTILTDNGASSAALRVIPTSSTWRSTTSTPQRTRVGSPRTNGFVERFNGTVLEEFFRSTMRRQLYESVEALQADLDAWLHHYNHERPHLGYRNQVAGRGRLSSCSSASHPQDKEVKKTRQAPGQRRHRRAGRGASPRARGVPYRNQHGRADHHRTRRRLG